MKNDVQDAVLRPKEKSVEYKARFVARGLSHKEGIDYEETFATTGRIMCAN